MEYMVHADGSLQVFERIPKLEDVLSQLAAYGGVAYYWHNKYVGWARITPLTTRADELRISSDEVPAEVLLAAMLE